MLKDAKSLFDQFWKTEIDLFASCLNTKCNKYASYKLDSDASHVNGFSLSWSDLNFYIFPPFSFWKSACQTCTTLDDSLGDSPLLENTAMVPIICTIVETRTDTTINTSPSTPASVSRNKLRAPNLGSVQSVSSNFLGSSQQQERQLTLPRSSWRASTQLAYSTPVQRWLEFCSRRQLNPYQPTVSQVFDFFHTFFELGLNYSATGAHWSAISATVEIPGVPQLGEHWLVSRFIKELFHLGLPQPRYAKTCDVNKVLFCLKSLGPIGSLNLKQLTLKTVALLTISAGRRIHTCSVLST